MNQVIAYVVGIASIFVQFLECTVLFFIFEGNSITNVAVAAELRQCFGDLAQMPSHSLFLKSVKLMLWLQCWELSLENGPSYRATACFPMDGDVKTKKALCPLEISTF